MAYDESDVDQHSGSSVRTDEIFDRIELRLDTLEQYMFEARYLDNLGANLACHFDRPRVLAPDELDGIMAALRRKSFTGRDWDSLKTVSLLATAHERSTGRGLYLVGELSIVVHDENVQRARRATNMLISVGLIVLAIVDGQSILPAAAALADELGVRYWLKPSTAA